MSCVLVDASPIGVSKQASLLQKPRPYTLRK